jgi:hypothetical protein
VKLLQPLKRNRWSKYFLFWFPTIETGREKHAREKWKTGVVGEKQGKL